MLSPVAPSVRPVEPLDGGDVVERLREVPLAVDGGLDLQHRDYRLGEEVLYRPISNAGA